ncbi:MAG: helix-turn-helix domain-containing protein [Tannerellaceae bacterium]|jgi:AraC-like DNA-binding protein|nr:helix-turn-helix domain-containing protein [Tannerellaceae bacterium]
MENLFYIEDHVSCHRYKSDFQTGFKCATIKKGSTLEKLSAACNHLFLLKEGELRIRREEYAPRKIRKEECILIPKGTKMSCEALEDSVLLVMSFDVLQHICDKAMLHSYQSMRDQVEYNFIPTPIRYPLTSFVDLLIGYLKGGIDCEHLHEIKEKEFFLVLRRCYSKEEILHLLYPIIGVSDFKGFILQNYLKVESVTELVDKAGMKRTAFDMKFRETFGTSPRQWILSQIARHVRYKAMDPDVTLRELINEFKFHSATHFCRFCKQQYGCTPGELLKKSRFEQEKNAKKTHVD